MSSLSGVPANKRMVKLMAKEGDECCRPGGRKRRQNSNEETMTECETFQIIPLATKYYFYAIQSQSQLQIFDELPD